MKRSLILCRHGDVLACWDTPITDADIEREFEKVPIGPHLREALKELVTYIVKMGPEHQSHRAAMVQIPSHEFVIDWMIEEAT